jgi:hypothetical protein
MAGRREIGRAEEVPDKLDNQGSKALLQMDGYRVGQVLPEDLIRSAISSAAHLHFSPANSTWKAGRES